MNRNEPSHSAIAKHCLEEHHTMGATELIKEVRNNWKLDAYESLLIINGKNLVNIDNPPMFSPLFSQLQAKS
jgi:hypothetical protein